MVDIDILLVAEKSQDDRKADNGLSGGYAHHKKDNHGAIRISIHFGESHQSEIDGIEHQLYTHKNYNRVAAGHDADGAQRKQDHADHQVAECVGG